jgi:hypothetical protein
MGILPLFVWCMLALPVFGAALVRLGDAALLLPIALYAAFRTWQLALPGLGPSTGIAFEPLAWQLPFMLGAWAGRRALLQGHVLPQRDGRVRATTVVAAGIVTAGLMLRLGWYRFVPWSPPVPEVEAWVGKEGLAPPRLLHALALAWLVAALVPRDSRWMHGLIGRALATIGRHSLYVFCWGLFLSWGASVLIGAYPDRIWPDPLAILVGSLAMALFARSLDARAGRGQNPEPLSAEPAPTPARWGTAH